MGGVERFVERLVTEESLKVPTGDGVEKRIDHGREKGASRLRRLTIVLRMGDLGGKRRRGSSMNKKDEGLRRMRRGTEDENLKQVK